MSPSTLVPRGKKMAIEGLGNDLVEIARIEQVLRGSSAERFIARVLTESERAILAQHKQPARYFAKRWAAKEAAAKALGTGIAAGVTFQDFEVSNSKLGQPEMKLFGMAAELAQQRQIKRIWLSLSDEQRYALASVVLES